MTSTASSLTSKPSFTSLEKLDEASKASAPLDGDFKQLTQHCKQIIVGLKQGNPLKDYVEALKDSHEQIMKHLQQEGFHLHKLIEIPKPLEAAVETFEGLSDGSEKEIASEQVKKIIIALLQELADIRKALGEKYNLINQQQNYTTTSDAPEKSSIGGNLRNQRPLSVVSKKAESVESIPAFYDHYAEDEKANLDEKLTLFLQMNNNTRKISITRKDASLSRLQMLFMEAFQYTPGQEDFPKIYMQDAKHKVFYELFTVDDLHDGCIVSLNSEASAIDSIKRHFDLSLSSLAQELKDLKRQIKTRSAIAPSSTNNNSAMFSDGQVTRPVSIFNAPTKQDFPRTLQEKWSHVLDMRQDLAVMRQLLLESQQSFRQQIDTSKNDVHLLINRTPIRVNKHERRDRLLEEDEKMAQCIKALSNEYRELAEEIDELRIDVVERGSYPAQKRVDDVTLLSQKFQEAVDAFRESLKEKKPEWKKTWEAELQNIVKEQSALKEREETLSHLSESHDNASEVLFQVLQFLELRNQTGHLRQFTPKDPDQHHSGLKTVMQELAVSSVDSNRRLQALEKMERYRKKYSVSEADQFAQELSQFIGSQKLRKVGGIQEVERKRSFKDREILNLLTNPK